MIKKQRAVLAPGNKAGVGKTEAWVTAPGPQDDLPLPGNCERSGARYRRDVDNAIRHEAIMAVGILKAPIERGNERIALPVRG